MLNAIARRSAVTFLASVTAVFAAPLIASAFDIVNRWSATQLNGGGLQRGDAVNLRWSVVPDGKSYDRSANSQLVQFLDDGWNVVVVGNQQCLRVTRACLERVAKLRRRAKRS